MRRLASLPWPRGLAGRTVLLMLASLTVFHLGSLWMHRHEVRGAIAELDEARVVERLVAAGRTVAALPADERDHAAHALSSPGLNLSWSLRPLVAPGAPPGRGPASDLRAHLADATPPYAASRLADAAEGTAASIRGSLPVGDGSWLNLVLAAPAPMSGAFGDGAVASTSVMAVGVVAASVLLVRWLTGPLRRLAQAADGIGRGRIVPVPQDGPEEVQRLAHALDTMQSRITRLVDARTQALAAVSHDLRTPITRLRLRAGFLDDAEAQAQIEADLDEMEAMIAATLAYLQGEVETEPSRLTDVAAMLSTICHAAADAGSDVRYEGPAHLIAQCRPTALRRAAANLIGNAVQYGGAARVRLAAEGGGITVDIDDDGPGIPPGEMDRVLEPFYRLEASRNRGTGGVGLGLTIARQAAEEQGGHLVLANRDDGGLRASIHLPHAGGQAPARDGRGSDILSHSRTSKTMPGEGDKPHVSA